MGVSATCPGDAAAGVGTTPRTSKASQTAFSELLERFLSCFRVCDKETNYFE